MARLCASTPTAGIGHKSEFRQGVGYTEEELPPPGIEEMDVEHVRRAHDRTQPPADDMIISRLATTKELTTAQCSERALASSSTTENSSMDLELPA